jgi:hypothetical protein
MEFHETLLELLGSARMNRERVSQHLITLTDIFDAAKRAIQTRDAPWDLRQSFQDSYQELVTDLGMPAFAQVRRRCAEIERILPRVCSLTEKLSQPTPKSRVIDAAAPANGINTRNLFR